MDKELTTIDVAKQKLEELIEAIPSYEPQNADEVKAKQLAVDAALKVSTILASLQKDDLERAKVDSQHELKLEEMKADLEKFQKELELQTKRLEVESENKELDRDLSYFEAKNRVDDAVRRAQEEARKARGDLRKDIVAVCTTVISGVFNLGQLAALRDVVNDGGIHMRLLPFIGKK